MAHIHVACESKLRSIVRSSMHPYTGDWVAIGRAVVCYDRATHAVIAGIECRHCRTIPNTFIQNSPSVAI